MIVQFGTTSKRVNSTEQPTMTASYNCTLKEGCSVISPVIIIDRKVVGHSYNTAYIADFGRYYWIRDIVYENARQYFYLDCDVLATYKSAIGNSTQYVLRAADDSNEYIIDQFYPTTMELSYSSQQLGTPWIDMNSPNLTTIWALGVINPDGVYYYAFTQTELRAFMAYLMSDTFTCDVLGITQLELNLNRSLKATVDPIQYLTGLVWIPMNYYIPDTSPALPHFTVDYVKIANKTTTFQAGKISDSSGGRLAVEYTLTQLDHPQASSRGKYLNAPGFSECQLVFPPFGIFNYNPADLAVFGTVKAAVYIDCTNGIGKLIVRCYPTTGVGEAPVAIMTDVMAQVGVPMPITQILTPGLSVVDMAVRLGGMAVAAASGNALGAIAGGASAMDSYYNAKVPRASTIGSRGNFAGLYGRATFDYTWKLVVDDDVADHGRPLCETVQLSTLDGFQMILNPHIAIPGTAEEADRINTFLAEGYFYE